ncbi:MAG: M14 family metallopeptidase [Gemmatimonadota bacterium]
MNRNRFRSPPRPARRSGSIVAAVLAAGLLALPGTAWAQGGGAEAAAYHSDRDLAAALASLRRAPPDLVSVETIATSPGGRAVQAVRLAAAGDPDARPALLVVAGGHGPHLIGTEAALAALRRLVEAHEGADGPGLLDRVTVYVIPRANPDAAAAFFASPLRERTRNETPWDDDRDGETDEDGPDDLNGDGLITMMRVADPSGDWMADPDDPELMRKVDRAKGEAGAFRLYTEGRDDDGDESWNEDPPGGVDVNRNFPYAYEFFGQASGVHQVSAPEARAVAQFFVDHPNIAVVYALGPQDNLLEAWKSGAGGKAAAGRSGGRPSPGARKPLKAILEEDAPWFAEVASRFREATGLDSGPKSAPPAGDVLSFAYYDMGRWAFGSRAWWIPPAGKENAEGEKPAADSAAAGAEPDSSAAPAAAADSEATPAAGAHEGGKAAGRAEPGRPGGAAKDGGKAGAKKKEKDPLEEERRALAWLRENVEGGFIPWTEVDQPDFPGRRVEVGGFRPFARIDPPAADIDSVAARQARFVEDLAAMLPSLSLRDVLVEAVRGRAYRITARVANDGFLPTLSALGERARWPRRVRVELQTNGQRIAGGRAVQLLGAIPGSGGSVDLTWLVVGAPGSKVTLRASSPVAGRASETLTLR